MIVSFEIVKKIEIIPIISNAFILRGCDQLRILDWSGAIMANLIISAIAAAWVMAIALLSVQNATLISLKF